MNTKVWAVFEVHKRGDYKCATLVGLHKNKSDVEKMVFNRAIESDIFPPDEEITYVCEERVIYEG